jgi:hypothetical protein
MTIEEQIFPNAWYLDLDFRKGNGGFKVRTYTGKVGRTYHDKEMIGKKMPVYIDGMKLPMLCDPDTLTLIDLVKD